MADFNVEVPTITSAEELDALLAAQGAEEVNEDGSKIKKPKADTEETDAEEFDEDDDELSKLDKKKDKVQKDKGLEQTEDDEEEGNDEGDKDKENNYSNVIAFLDSKHNLGLNLDNLPKDLTREDEAEIVSDLFEKVVKNTNDQVRKYEHVQTLLEDSEVVALLKAKSEGKGLKDLYAGFVTSTEGMSSEQVVFDDLKKKYPKLPDTAINNMIAAQKKENVFEEVVVAIREQRKEDETRSSQQRLRDEQDRIEQQSIEREEEDNMFTELVTKVNKINDIVFTDEMKADVLAFTLKRDKEGLSPLDKALQSDVGVLRASLGIMLLDKLMQAKASVATNKKNGKLVERLFQTADQANQSSGSNRETREVSDELYNRF